MTGIDIETIESQGQSLETIQSDIIDFFWQDTVLIGQNISFDIGFLKKFLPWCAFAHSIDTYPLAASSIPYLKSYSLESIDHHLKEKYTSYNDRKSYLLTTLSEWKTLSAHDALYDCITGLCFIWRWCSQISNFEKEFPILWDILSKTKGEWITTIIARPEGSPLGGRDEAIDFNASFWTKRSEVEESQSIWDPSNTSGWRKLNLPILTSPLTTEKKSSHNTIINREKTPHHSKRSTKWINLEKVISELPHPCIIAVSHGSKIDIIKRACKNEQFDYLKEEQILDQEKLSQWLEKDTYTEDEFLFVCFYLAHHRDGYRILQPTLTTHKYILDYLQIKKIELKKDKKILCSQWWLYYTIENNPERKEIYKDYPICILDADRRHTTYNDYAQRWMGLNTILYQREKYDYEIKQKNTMTPWNYDTITTIINSLTFFIAHFTHDSEKQYRNLKQYKREIDYLLNHQSYTNTAESWNSLREIRNNLLRKSKNIPKYLQDNMNKLSIFFQNPLKIQRNINQNKDTRYTIAPAVRYIDFAEYLKMFGDHKVLFFSPARSEYKTFIGKNTPSHTITIKREDRQEQIITLLKSTSWSTFIICHNTEKSKKIFNDLHESCLKESHTLIGEYLTGWVAKNSIKQTDDKPNIMIGGYHMLLHFWGEGNKIDNIIIVYVPNNINTFIEEDIRHYAPMK
jgi:hypothetical protein